jgi:hypothetical protein
MRLGRVPRRWWRLLAAFGMLLPGLWPAGGAAFPVATETLTSGSLRMGAGFNFVDGSGTVTTSDNATIGFLADSLFPTAGPTGARISAGDAGIDILRTSVVYAGQSFPDCFFHNPSNPPSPCSANVFFVLSMSVFDPPPPPVGGGPLTTTVPGIFDLSVLSPGALCLGIWPLDRWPPHLGLLLRGG